MAITVKSDEARLEDEGTLGGPKFDPPLYLQRYNAVIEVARRTQSRKVQWQSRMIKQVKAFCCMQVMWYLLGPADVEQCLHSYKNFGSSGASPL